MGNQEALNDLTAVVDQPLILLVGLDALGNHLDIEHATQVNNAARDGQIPGRSQHAANEVPIKFQGVQIKIAQVRKGAVACTEIVQRHAHANVMQILQLLAAVHQIVNQRRLGDLDFQLPRFQAMQLHGALQLGRQIRQAELRRTHADAHHQIVREYVAPALALGRTLFENPAAELVDQARFFQQRNKHP